MTDQILTQLSPRFRRLYAKTGRPSIAPEKLLRALLLQLYTVRSERMLMEQLDYNLLFRWFVGLNMDDVVWDATVFTKNRLRLLEGDIADAFFQAVLQQARTLDLLSSQHFTVDGTLLEAWAGQKSFRRVDRDDQSPTAGTGEGANPTVNFHGEKRSNQTHCLATDPDAMLARKSQGTGAVLAYRGHLLTENRNGLVVSTLTTRAYGSAERHAALLMAEGLPGTHRVTLGADKGYDAHDFTAELRQMDVTPHLAQNNTNRRSPPCAVGLVSGSIIFSCSITEPGHPWGDDQRQGIFMFRTNINEMNVQPIDFGDELRQGLQFRLALAPVVVCAPIAGEFLHCRKRHSLRFIRDRFAIRPPC